MRGDYKINILPINSKDHFDIFFNCVIAKSPPPPELHYNLGYNINLVH